MSTPLCHRMIGALPRVVHHDSGEPYPARSHADPSDCLCRGSECALWVPQADHTGGWPLYYVDEDGDIAARKCGKSGRGWCADNLRRAPWTDPAGGGGL